MVTHSSRDVTEEAGLTAKRKGEHIRICLEEEVGAVGVTSGFERYDVGRPDLHVTGDPLGQARLLHASLERLLELPDYVVVLPSHYAGSVCGRGLSGNPFSSIGFERTHNAMLQYRDPDAFAEALVSDAPPPPAHQAEIVAANKLGETLTAA